MAEIKKTKKTKAELREEWREAGLCITCGLKEPRKYKNCYECRVKRCRKDRRRKDERKRSFAGKGLCVRCGGEREDKSFRLCAECRWKHKEWRLKQDKPDTMCTRTPCKNDRREDRAYCQECLDYYRDLRKRLNDGGLCRCGEPQAPGRKSCAPCLARNRESAMRARHRKKESGLCTACGQAAPRPSLTLCQSCSDNQTRRSRAYMQGHIAKGICPLCRDKKLPAGRYYCRPCRKRHNTATRSRRVSVKKGLEKIAEIEGLLFNPNDHLFGP